MLIRAKALAAVGVLASLTTVTALTAPLTATASPLRPKNLDLTSVSGTLNAVTATTASNAWAVGYTGDITAAHQKTLIMHWNGSAWK
jgi:hypothetical protein